MDNDHMDLAGARRRRDELMARIANMDPAAVGEMAEFLRSLPAEVVTRLRDDLSR